MTAAGIEVAGFLGKISHFSMRKQDVAFNFQGNGSVEHFVCGGMLCERCLTG